MVKVLVEQLIKDNNLEIIIDSQIGLKRIIECESICRPGMEITGFLDYYNPKRVLLIGTKESSYLTKIGEKIAKERLKKILDLNPPVIVYTINVTLPSYLLEMAKEKDICVVKSYMGTQATSSKLYAYLQERLAPRLSIHGTLLDIYGLGVLIMGHSGIGKSETALDLIKRGHQLIGDDLVEIFEKEPGNLIGEAPELLKRYIEIRGIGILDVVHMFGAGAYRPRKNVKLVVELEDWNKDSSYDRLGLENESIKFFETSITKMVIPVLPGRNVALLIESAAIKEKLKIYMNQNDARSFVDAINKKARGDE